MKKIDTQYATNLARQPLYADGLKHLQDGYKEAISSLAKFGIKNYTTGEVRILHGCINSGSGSVYNISAGAVYYNGEVYQVPAASFTSSGSDVATADVVTSFAAFDPTTFSDGLTVQSVHQISQIVITSNPSGTGIKDFSNFIPATKDYFVFADSSLIGIAGTSYAAIAGFTHTTPDDGYTRKYLIQFKTEVICSNGNVTSSGQCKIYDGTTDLDSFNVGKGTGTSGDVYSIGGSLMTIADIAPNTTITIQSKYTTAAASIRNSVMTMVEL